MRRGWCPGVHAPMPSGDGLLVRVKPPGGRLTAAALLALAEASERWASGTVELTSRGNLQLRGVIEPDRLAHALVAANLADPDPAREARRNVLAVPPCDDALVARVEAVMAATPGLPAKACAVVDGTGVRLHAGFGPGSDWAAALRPAVPETLPGVLLHLPFGRTDAATLARLAQAVPELRTTPWRALLSPLAVPGFEQAGRIAACVGAPACASASVPAQLDAARLQALGFSELHVSGCAKGCAYSGAIRTLVGRDGRYDLVRHGRAADPPQLRGLTLEQAIAVL